MSCLNVVGEVATIPADVKTHTHKRLSARSCRKEPDFAPNFVKTREDLEVSPCAFAILQNRYVYVRS
jgi:hypothetical protein